MELTEHRVQLAMSSDKLVDAAAEVLALSVSTHRTHCISITTKAALIFGNISIILGALKDFLRFSPQYLAYT